MPARLNIPHHFTIVTMSALEFFHLIGQFFARYRADNLPLPLRLPCLSQHPRLTIIEHEAFSIL